MSELTDKVDHLITESLRAAEMRQGCTNHTYYAELIRKQLLDIMRNHYLNMTPEKLREEVAKVFYAQAQQASRLLSSQLKRFLPMERDRDYECYSEPLPDWDDIKDSILKTPWLMQADQILSLVMAYKVIKEVEK